MARNRESDSPAPRGAQSPAQSANSYVPPADVLTAPSRGPLRASWDPCGLTALPESPRVFKVAIALVLLLAAALRIPSLSTRSLWFDEFHTWNDAYWLPPEESAHAMFFHIVNVFTSVLGRDEIGLRAWPWVAGVAGVGVIGFLGRRVAGPVAGVLAAVLLALSPEHIAYSQEARYYAPMVLFSAMSLLGIVDFICLEGRARWGGLVLFVLAGVLGRGNHPTSIALSGALVLALGLVLLATRWGRASVLTTVLGDPDSGAGRKVLGIAATIAVAGFGAYAALRVLGPMLQGGLPFTFARRTPGVEFSPAFFQLLAMRLGVGVLPVAPLASLPFVLFTVAALAGLGWCARRRIEWVVLSIISVSATLFALFAYPLSQTFDPKYIGFLIPIQMVAAAAGLALVIEAVRRWLGERIRSTQAEFSLRAMGVGVCALAFGALLAPAIARHYATCFTPIRPAVEYVFTHSTPATPIVGYGHTNYGLSRYSDPHNRSEQGGGGTGPATDAYDRLRLLRWPSGAGILDAARIRAELPRSGELHFVSAWPYDLPPQLKRLLEEDFEEVARFPTSRDPELDSRVLRWKAGPLFMHAGRGLELSAQSDRRAIAETSGTIACEPVALLDEGTLVSLHRMDAELLAEFAAPPREFAPRLGGGPVALVAAPRASDADPRAAHTLRASVQIPAGKVAWSLGLAKDEPAPLRVVLRPVRPLKIDIPPTEIAARSRWGELKDEGNGPHPDLANRLVLVRNCWVDYSLALPARATYSLALTASVKPGTSAFLELERNGESLGILFFGGEAMPQRREVPFVVSDSATTMLRLRLISESSNPDTGKGIPGAELTLEGFELREVPDAASATLRDDRWVRDLLKDGVVFAGPRFLRPSEPGAPPSAELDEQWLAEPQSFTPTLEYAGDPSDPRAQRLRVKFLPPYSGTLVSPAFVLPPIDGPVVYRQRIESRQIYRMGATPILVFLDVDGNLVGQSFPSEGPLNDNLDWDFVYAPVEGPSIREYVWLDDPPASAVVGLLLIRTWPKPVPERTPELSCILEPGWGVRIPRTKK